MGTMQYSFLVFLALCAAAAWTPTGARVIHKRAAFYLANDTMCIVDGDVYRNGDPVPTDDECERCTCRPPGFSCVLRDCDTKPGCKAVRRAGECCPEYVCGCVHNNRVYEDGEIIKDLQNNCYTCRCHGSSISCTFAECLFRGDCPPEYVPGECCPRYDHCPPLSTTSSSTIFTTESTTQSEIVQQQKVFLNLTTQHLEKFTDEGTTLTVVDILPSSTTTTTTQAYSEEASTTTTVTVKFTLTDGAVTSITDLDLNTLTTLLPLQTSTYTETTKYIIPDENESKLTTTQASTSVVSDGDSSSKEELLFSTETVESEKEELFSSTTKILTESTKVTTPTPDTLLEQDTSEKIPELHSSDENTTEIAKNDSVTLDDSTDLEIHFDETGDHVKTPTDAAIIDSSTTSYESTQVFDGEEIDSEEESDSASIPSETSDESVVHSSTIDKDDKLLTENPEETHESSTTADFSSATEIVKEEISLLPESLHNVSDDRNATEFVTIASFTEESIEHEYESKKSSTIEETHKPSSEFTEMLDGEEKFSTDKLDKLSVATDSLGLSFETSSTEKSRETTSAIESTTVQSFNQSIEVQETTTEHISVNSQDEEKYFSTQQTKENEEIPFTRITRPVTELSSEMGESFIALGNKSHEISSTLQQLDTTSSGERVATEDWKETTQYTDFIESQTSSLEDKQSTNAPSEYPTDLEISDELKSFTESPLFSSEISTESENLSTEMESTNEKHEIYSSTIASVTKITEQPLISDTPHVSEIEFSETIHNDSSDDTLGESNTSEHTSSDSYSLTILDSETSSSTVDTNISDHSEESGTTVVEQQNTSSISVEDHISVETSSIEPKFGVFTTNYESTTQEKNSDMSSDMTPKTTSKSSTDGNKFVTETTKTDTSIHENISELSIIDLSETSETETSKEILETTTSAIIENNESTELSFTENSGSKLGELDYNSVSTTDSNQNEGHSGFPKISESTTEDDIIQNTETEGTSEGSSRIKELTTTDSLTDTASNVSENGVTILMDQTEEDVLESETLQSNFDTIVSNQQTTKSGENFDYKLSEDPNEFGISKLVSDTTESENISTLKHVASEDNNNTSSSSDSNSALGSTVTKDESGLDVTSSLKENDIGETSQFSTSSTNDINTTSFPLIQDTKTKDDEVTKTIENHSRDSTHLSPDIDVIATKIPIDVNDTSLIANESETEGSDGFNNDLTSTLSNDYENFSSGLKTSIVNSHSNDVPALILFDHENNETITSNYSDYTPSDEQTESNKLVTNLETDDLEFSPKLSNHQGTTSVNDEDYSALDSEENLSEETNEDSTLDVIRTSETEQGKYVSFDETESFSPSESTFHQTEPSTLSTHKDLISEENNPDAKENVLLDGYSDEINTATIFEADSEEHSFSSTVNPISNSYSTEEIHSIGEFTNTKSEDAEKFSVNVENTKNWKLDTTTPEQDSSNTKLTTISLEQTSSNAKNNTLISINELEAHADEVTYEETTLNVENFTNPNFQPAENNSYPQFHDNDLLSKSNENETLIVDAEDHTSKFENDEFSSKTKDGISANEDASIDSNEGNSFEETFEGEEALSSENTVVTEKNVIHISDELNLSNQGNGNENLDKSDLALVSVISSNDNPPFTSTSTSNINNIPEEESTDIEISDGDNYSTSNLQILFGQNNGELESSENPVNNSATPATNAVTENKENESNEELSTVDENTFGEAMHEYSDDHVNYDFLKLTSTVSQNTLTTNHDQSFDYNDIEMDSEEETTEFLNINITKPSVSYRVETARNLDDSTTSDNLSMGNEPTSLNVESFTKDEVSNTQSYEEHSNISKMAEISDDTSINSTVKASYLHDDSKIFNDMGDHFSGGNLYSEFVIPSVENLHKASESPQQNLSNITESEIYEVDKKNDIEHVSSVNASNSTTFPKNTFEAYGYLGGVFITGKSKYNDHKKNSHEISHPSIDEISIVENKHNVEASENPSLILDSEGDLENNNGDISELESDIGNGAVVKTETTADPAVQYFDENNFGDTENLAFGNQSSVKKINSTQNELQIASTENININYNISSNTSFLHPNTTNETSEKQNFQISVESSKNGSGPEKGGEWLEPTLPSSNAAVFLHSQSDRINSNESANSVVESDDYFPSVNTSEENEKGPEKGGELFEPTISNPFHLDQNPGQNEKTVQSFDELAAEYHSAIEKSSFATDLPLYVLSRGKESNHPGALKYNSAQESDSEGSDVHSNYLRNNNSQIDEENSTKEIPSFPITILNETFISFNDSQNVLTEPLNETEESNFTSRINESILMSDENRVNLLQPYSLIDVISNVFKAPGYDSEVHSHFLKEQVDYSGKEEPLVLVKRNADTSQERIVFEKESAVKPDPNSKLYHDKTNPHILQTRKTIYSAISPVSATNSRPRDPPPAKVTSSFIFVVSPNDDDSGAIKPSSSSSGLAQEMELTNDNMFSQNNAQKTRN